MVSNFLRNISALLLALFVGAGTLFAAIPDTQLSQLNSRIKDYDYVYPFSEGLAMVIKGEKMGFVDKSGDLVIPLTLNRCEECIDAPFSETSFVKGLYADRTNGVIDKRGNRLTPDGKVLRLYKEYNDYEDDALDKADKGVIIAEMQLKNGGKKSYIFENGELVYVMDNDYPIFHPQTGRCLKETIDGKTVYIGEKHSKKLGYEDVYNTGKAFIPNPEYSWVNDGKSSFIMNRHGKYGIIDENCNVLHPFLHNFVLQHLNGLAILYKGKEVDDEMGLSRYLFSCDVYKDGKKIIKDASPCMMEPPSFKFILFHGLTEQKMKQMNEMHGVSFPESTNESFILTQSGEKLDRFPWGENFLKFKIDDLDIISWELVDKNGKKVFCSDFFLLSMSDKYLTIVPKDVEYEELMMNLEGKTRPMPEYHKYIEFGILPFDAQCESMLCDYQYLLSEEDNKLNATSYEKRSKAPEGKLVEFYSEGLLLTKDASGWKFVK